MTVHAQIAAPSAPSPIAVPVPATAEVATTAAAPAAPTPKELRTMFASFPTGVTAVAALVDGAPVGLAANSFTSVSLEPALVSVCADLKSSTWPILRSRPRLGISILAAEHEQACLRLASRSGDRFADLDFRSSADGAVFIERASAWIECSLEAQYPAGDHEILVLRVHDIGADPDVTPLVFHRSAFRDLSRRE
ncbi:flavin reductase (DIM6/NTAB) family NADH-FMN oxidoreductase RutF [Catenulispora sp. GP43]|uniref:flavin reductase family protein n=1 Tax=Catenulispora sp. GP43 TaxID=3156263 RepID=UPI003511AA4F